MDMLTELFAQAQKINIDVLPQVSADTARVRVILNIVFSIVGAISLLVITIAGFRYVLSHGDSNLITQSKNTILYALIGLAVSLTAVAIINFVVNWVG